MRIKELIYELITYQKHISTPVCVFNLIGKILTGTNLAARLLSTHRKPTLRCEPREIINCIANYDCISLALPNLAAENGNIQNADCVRASE